MPRGKGPRKSRGSHDDSGDEEPIEFEDEEPKMDTSFKQCVVVDGLPVVPPEKHEKLLNVLRKFFNQDGIGKVVEGGLEMPKDPATGQSLGFAFVQYETEEEAKQALAKANNYRLDRSHVFKLSPLDDYHKYMAIPDEEVELKPPPYEPSENLKGWLLDEQARDQYVVRYNEETEIWWNDAVKGQQDTDPAYAKRNWTDTYINWSPRGTYLATFHRLGIMLWGGPSWKKLLKLTHGGVKLIDFSPCENFVVTWSPETNQDKALIVWSVKTGAKLREFQGHVPKEGGPDHMEWPAFRWSHDDSYFARLGDDCIYVYESTTMKLIKDKAEKRTSVHSPLSLIHI